MKALPGVAPNFANKSVSPSSSNSDPADPIPDNVLANPFIGEARRFDGTVAPNRWMIAQGQTIAVADNRPLFNVLGTAGGGNGKTTFKLPSPKRGWIIAVAGTLPTTPAALLGMGRHMSRQDSLGPGATAVMVPVLSERVRRARDERAAAVRAEQSRAASAPRFRYGGVMPVSPDLRARIDADREQSRSAALAGLTAQNRARAEGLVDAILSGRVSHAQATRDMASALSGAEARALLGIFDTTQRTFRSGWAGMDHSDPQQEAARYLMAVAFTREQLYRLRTMPTSE
ncbi:MAG: phage tail Collar [Candidatus Eremiobacteraeota bacterium]|nr:phage tail Collar [Candidatus Eremiobacteraeota bacterium]